jgi:hypothetical protein
LTRGGDLCHHPGVRYKLPLAATVVCLVAAGFVPPIVAYVLVVAGFGFALDAGTTWLARAGGTGGMKDFKQ